MMARLLLALCPLLAAGVSLKLNHEELALPTAYYWAGKNGDLLRTGSSQYAVTRAIENGPTWSFHERAPPEWEAKLQAAGYTSYKALVRTAPLIDENKNIYLSTVTSGNVYKFSPDGTQLWMYNSGQQIPDIGALMGGRLFVGTHKGEAIALDMETGKEVWRVQPFTASAGDTWSVTAADGVVISAGALGAGQNNKVIAAMNATDGKTLWYFLFPVADIYNILVAIKDGAAVCSDSKGTVFKMDLYTGTQIWRVPTPEHGSFTTGGTVIGPNGVVYTTWNEGPQLGMEWGHGMIGAYDFATGAKIWSTNVGYMANNAAVVGNLAGGHLGVVIGVGANPDVPRPALGIWDGKGPVKKQQIIALDALTGAFLWRFDLPDWHGSALGDDHRPDICLPDAFGNAAIGGDGTVYIGHASGLFYSIRDNNGDGNISESDVSAWQTGAAFQGTPAIAPGLLAATPCDGLHVWRL